MLDRNKEQVPPIVNTRVFPFTRERVFTAWSDPDILARWFGPKGFTNTIHLFTFRNGGPWKLTMHGPDGTDYHNENIFLEIIRPGKIVYRHLEPVHTFTSTVLFEENAGSTRLVLSMVFDQHQEYEKVKDFIQAANEENFDRLENVLQQLK